MAEVIDRFAPGFDGGRLVTKTTEEGDIDSFDLVIARDGRETAVGNLSEGERELVGFIVAMAGYRTYEVAERVPAILVDGVGQLSADNLKLLTDYLEDATDVLITTAYPEAGDFGNRRIDPESWDVVTDQERPVP
jgi:DNA repair exonuclease SbcCD ATPase subunit